MKIEMVPAIESESAEDQTKVMRLKVTGPIDPADAVLRRARELVQRTGSTSMAESFEWAISTGAFVSEK